MKKLFFALVTATLVTASLPARADEPASEVPATDAIWYCQAQSYATGLWYYWYSYDAYYARNMAYNACVAQNGYTCTVGCTWGY